MAKTAGQLIAADLPVRDEACESDLISLVDIVVTGIETDWTHFWVKNYDYEASGEDNEPWATLSPLKDAAGLPENLPQPVNLTAETVRAAVAAYMDSRIEGGMTLHEAARLIDGSYTDAVIADSILQFALYGDEIYS